MKKKILTAVALIAALVLSLFTAACGDDGVDAVKFKVTAKYNAEQGVVTVTDADGKQKTEFGAGANVVVTVTANEGYELDAFTVNGVGAELTNGVYGFVISANTLVEATFKQSGGDNPNPGGDEKTPEELFAEAFESVKTTFMAVGSYTYKEEGGNAVTYNLTTVFGTGAVNIIEMNADGEVEYDEVYVDKGGKLAQPYHTLNNEIAYNYPSVEEPFADYDNPFKKLSATDFKATETKNVFALNADDDVLTAAATAITGWNEGIASFTVTIADGKVTRINITTNVITVGEGEDAVSYTSVYTFTVSEWGTAEVDEDAFAPYKTAAEHTALKTALEQARDAKNYTIVVTELSLTELDEDLEYNVYVTENAVYYDCEGYEEGYVQMGEGSSAVVYPFDYNPETELVTLRDATVFPTIASMRASFDGFAPEIFELDEDGAYILRDECYTLDNVHDILINFGEGIDQIRLYASYTLDVKFILNDDGALYQVELYYYVGDAYIMRTLTYVDWDETTLPIGFDNCEFKSVLDYYVGTYTDGMVTVVIDQNSIVINDEEFEIAGYDIQYDLFTGEWNGEEWYITMQGKKQLLLFCLGDDDEDGVTYTLTSTAIDPVEIPVEFGGVWSVNDKTVAIAYDKIEYNGAMLTVLSYDEEDGLYSTDGELTYRMFAEEDNDGNPVLLVIVYVDGLSTAYYDMAKAEDAVIVPEVLIGTYEKLDYTYGQFNVVVGLTSVQMEIDGVAQEVALLSAEEVTGWGAKFQAIVIDVNGKEYYLVEGGSNATVTLEREEDRFSVTLNRVQTEQPPTPSVAIPEAFHGKFVGEDDGVEYTVTITANGLTLQIGNAAAITVSEYEYDDGAIDFKVDGVQFGVYNYEYEDGVDSITIYSYEGLHTTLARKGDNNTEIPEGLYGTYEGEDGWAHKTVKVVVDENGIEVYFNDVKQSVTVKNVVNEYYGDNVYVVIDEVEYLFGQYYDSFTFTSAADNGNALYVTLQKSTGGDDDVTIPEAFYGTFEGEDSYTHKTAKIVIAADGLTVTIDGGTPTVATDLVVTEEEYGGVKSWAATFKVDGKAYSMSEGSNADRIYFCSEYDSQMSFQTTLTRATQSGGDDDVTIPEAFYGTFEGDGYTITITADGITVKQGSGEAVNAVITDYSDYEGFTMSVGGVEYYLMSYGSNMDKLMYMDADDTMSATLNRIAQSGDEATIPEAFYGTFEGDGYTNYPVKVVISADGVTVTLNGGTPIVATDLVVTVSSYWAASFKLDGKAYEMSEGYTADKLNFASAFDSYNSFQTTLTRVTESGGDDEVTIPEKFYGNYMSADETSMIIIDDDGIYVLSGDIDAYAEIVAYDDSEGFTVTLDGDEYYILDMSYAEPVSKIMLMKGSTNVVLNREEE